MKAARREPRPPKGWMGGGSRRAGFGCVIELVHSSSGKVVAREVPLPSPRQGQLQEALGLSQSLPRLAPAAKVLVGTRKKINDVSKPRMK